jgi:recombinational DNA repair ATPase RecF
MDSARIRRLALTNFRSYRSASIELGAGPIILVGANGAGKTNLIEAISFLTPGRGLRRATLEEVAFSEGDGSWAVAAEVEGALGLATLGTGIAPAVEDAPPQRMCRIDREPVASVAAFADHIRVIWLTPAMDRLFNEPASERRRFLDRLVLQWTPSIPAVFRRWSAVCVRATACWKTHARICIGLMRSSMKPPSLPLPLPHCVQKRCVGCRARWQNAALFQTVSRRPRSLCTGGWSRHWWASPR